MTTTAEDGAASTMKKDAQSYEEEIRSLKTQLEEKDKQLADLQKGLEAQVHMVMELENLEQKELHQYELKIDANKKLIQELGERVGQETTQKAELEVRVKEIEQQVQDQKVGASTALYYLRAQDLSSYY